ncbi:MAG: DegT/DnrJ/EryC1/StrS family aminotransferase [Phycisphaerales bacterium]
MSTATLGSSASLAVNGGTPVSSKPVPFMSTALAQSDIDAAVAVLHSGMLRAAKKCEEFETKWSAITEAKHSMTCANGTCALQLAYDPLFSCGDEILVPAWSYIATVSMVVARGCTPVFVDCNPETFQIDVADAAKKITPKTKGIAATHLYGCPVDIDGIEALAKKHNLKVVYDAAQSHLATWKGQGLGKFGDVVTYSLYATKNLATGEGGLVTVNDDTLARKIKLLRSHGETDKYLHEQVGYNYRMNDIAGAIGVSRLERLPAQTAQRQKNAARYDAILAGIPGLIAPKTTPGGVAVYHLYTVKMDLSKFRCTRDEFCKALMAEGVPTATHYPRSLPKQPALSRWDKNDCPIADSLAARVFCLPMHHDLNDDHFATIESALKKVAAAFGV